MKHSFLYFFLFCFLAAAAWGIFRKGPPGARREWPTSATGRKVEVIRSGGGFQLLRDGRPYEVKGAAGTEQLERLRQAGGNSIRVYETGGLDTLLDRCRELGLTVLVSFDLGKPQHYFNYRDGEAVAAQEEKVRSTVLKYKDHPALLAWGLGNEVLLHAGGPYEYTPLLEALEDLTQMVKMLDPDHPVTTAISVSGTRRDLILKHCPSIDFITVNAFDILTDPQVDQFFVEMLGADRPFMLSEWGFRGWWQGASTQWKAPIEQTEQEKQQTLAGIYEQRIAPNTDRCIGSYVFFWGHRQEMTPTWFSFFSDKGEKTPLVDTMHDLWGGPPPSNRAPLLDSLFFDPQAPVAINFLEGSSNLRASVRAFDPEGDPLTFFWEILEEGPLKDPERGGLELRPPTLPGSFRRTTDASATFRLPDRTGPYRLFVYARDGQGNIASANLPFYTTDNRLTED